MNVLFVCNQGENRSRTAGELFGKQFKTRARGLFNNFLKSDDLEWADLVVVMEEFQRSEIGKRYPKEYLKKQILVLNVPDIYQYAQKELVDILNERFNQAISV